MQVTVLESSALPTLINVPRWIIHLLGINFGLIIRTGSHIEVAWNYTYPTLAGLQR